VTVVIEDESSLFNLIFQHFKEFILWLIAQPALDGPQADDYNKVFQDAEDLHKRKNAGYAGIGAVDHWANFRMAEWFGVSPLVGCLIRMTDKLIRVKHLHKNPEADQVHESLKDSLYDLAIYALIAICLLEEKSPTPESDRMPT
jgi:hypothetical protein